MSLRRTAMAVARDLALVVVLVLLLILVLALVLAPAAFPGIGSGSVRSAFEWSRARELGSVGPVTYHSHVRRIIRESCQSCHRSGGSAPFSLEEYEQVHDHRERIGHVVESGRMPPWLADPEVGEWANERRLSEQDRLTLLAWIHQGAPEGIPGDRLQPDSSDARAATPRSNGSNGSNGWSIGEPDAVVRLPRAVSIPARGVVPYRYISVETDFPDDRWIQAMQIRATAPAVVHHVLVLLDVRSSGVDLSTSRDVSPRGVAAQEFRRGLDGFFAVHVPGHLGVTYPKGTARLLPRGATLEFQLHYTPNGRATEDRTELGFVFSDDPPRYAVETGAVVNTRFVIPPGARDHEVTATHRFIRPTALLGFFPHMHLRGTAFRYDLAHPDGREEVLLRVPRYDFDWQEEYLLKTPIALEAGARLRATARFDNSRRNPRNPDPSQEVRFGEQTFEEMMNGYFHYLVPVENQPPSEHDPVGFRIQQ